MKLSERQVAFLAVMQDGREWNPGQIFHTAFPDAPYRGRRDAGATRTLDAMEKLGLVSYRYPHTWDGRLIGGRTWWITTAGKAELEERGLLKRPEKKGIGQRLNGVPGHDGYVYGLGMRAEGSALVKVDVHRYVNGRTGEKIGTVEGTGWAGPAGVHALADTLIARTDGRQQSAG